MKICLIIIRLLFFRIFYLFKDKILRDKLVDNYYHSTDKQADKKAEKYNKIYRKFSDNYKRLENNLSLCDFYIRKFINQKRSF